MSDQPRLLRPVGAPLGLYLRPARNDHTPLMALMAEGRTDLSGLVLDACMADRHEELRTEARQHDLETVLDPRSVDLSTPGGVARAGIADLPWASEPLPQTAATLGGVSGDHLIDELVTYVAEKKFSAVLAPTHYLADGAAEPWFTVDQRLISTLRAKLDAAGQTHVCIYYPLAMRATVFRNPAQRRALVAALAKLPIDAVWLRVHPFGTTASGPLALRRYIEGCRDFHALGIPLVAEHTGTIGLALLAFGAVGGIESGITFGERYDVGSLLRPPGNNNPFSPAPRVYIEKIGAFLSRDQANELFENRQMKALFACKISGCCPRGATDMSADPRRHFILRRMSEVTYYSRPPEPLRAGLYLEEVLRPATDLALRATKVAPALDTTRRRLEGWRQALGSMHQQGPPSSVAIPPEGQRLQPRPRAAGE
jgi:hypothetical protein